MKRQQYRKFYLEVRRCPMVHTPAVWVSIESDAADAGLSVSEYIDASMSALNGMCWNLALLRSESDSIWRRRLAAMETAK